jgi:hypothetical protein
MIYNHKPELVTEYVNVHKQQILLYTNDPVIADWMAVCKTVHTYKHHENES